MHSFIYTQVNVYVHVVSLYLRFVYLQPSTINTSDEQTYDHTVLTYVQVGGQNLAISRDQNAKQETLLKFDIVFLFRLGCSAWLQELGSTTQRPTFFPISDRVPKRSGKETMVLTWHSEPQPS